MNTPPNNPMNDQIQKMMQNKSPKQMKMIVLGIIVVSIVGGIGWGLASGPLSSFLGERGLKLDKNSTVGVSFDKTKMWPSNMPSDVPQIQEGGIWTQGYDSKKNIWDISFKDLPQEVGENYVNKLQTNGWTITKNVKNEDAQTMVLYAEKGKLLLNYSQNFNVKGGSLKVERRLVVPQ